jgi:hypothetical protein
MPHPFPLIYINTFPGTGKLSIARYLLALLPPFILLDNHTLIDPVAAPYPRDHPNYAEERRCVRAKALREYVSCEKESGKQEGAGQSCH